MKLIDVCELIVDCPHSTAKDEGQGIPLVRTPNIGKGRLEFAGIHRVSETIYNLRIERATPKAGDLILAREAPVGNVALIMPGQKVCLGQRVVLIRPNQIKADSAYLTYYLLSKDVQHRLKSNANGAVVAHLNMDDIRNLEIELPDISVQKRIAGVLSCLDDKIALNNRINHNLEEQAILATHSFIFPDGDSSAPIVSLSDVCLKITDGSHYSPKDDSSSGIPMLSVKDMGRYSFDYSSCKHISEKDYQLMLANDCVPHVGDILVAKDGSYLKEVFINKTPKKQAILSSIAIFRPNPEIISSELLLYILKQPRVLKEVRDNYVSGSALPRIVLKDFKKLSFNLPSTPMQKQIRHYLSAISSEIQSNQEENEKLTICRDSLLKELMNNFSC